MNFHRFYRHKLSFFPLFCCHILLCQKFLSLFESSGINGASSRRTISRADIEYRRTNDFQVLPLCVKKSTPSHRVLSDKYATVGPVNKRSTPLLLGLQMTSAPQVWLSENQALLSSVPGTVCVCNCFEPPAQR